MKTKLKARKPPRGLICLLIAVHCCSSGIDARAQNAVANSQNMGLSPTNLRSPAPGKGVDAVEQRFRDQIKKTLDKLQDPALDEEARALLVAELAGYENNLKEHQRRESQHEAMRDGVYTQARALDEEMKARLAAAQAEYRERIAVLKEGQAQALADHQTNVQLWANYSAAYKKNDPHLIAKTESELAGYLTRKLESVDGKPYPQNLSLKQIMKYYETHPLAKTDTTSVDKKRVVRITLMALLVIPAAALTVFLLRQRKGAPGT